MFQIFSAIVALAALFGYLNRKFLRLPDTIGVMILAIVTSILIGLLNFVSRDTFLQICSLVEQLDFKTILFDFLLSFLLFAGAIHVDLSQLRKERATVLVYATVGVLISTALIGGAFYLFMDALGMEPSYLGTLVFGALISPTDPIAVLSLLKKAGAPKEMEIKIVGESLFNDGVGIVVFISLLTLYTMGGGESFGIGEIGLEFVREAFGGVALGLILGVIGIYMLKQIYNSPIIAVHITIALVMGGYAISSFIHVSGALAMVVLGLMIGDYLHRRCQNEEIVDNMNVFWRILDELLNAILFVLIGLEILVINFEINFLRAGLFAIVTVLVSRYLAITFSNIFLKKENRSSGKETLILTWAGLRGGISIALALTLPPNPFRDAVIFATYAVVVFSIIVQGLTIEKVVKKLLK